ncbi:CRISPR-associated endonuclease Cas1 [Sphingomonas cavernae]|uniref:CRISPR-associated endonuclease Cas1 n=1 Tax=Sphingomonas cavernae TaxID=2320861 RepID=A0A418W683_9SPHN|nr:CRISPR-associated endonuclease Cas1 [Sphingomonas cavernae]RJF85541.1 CRISPR-associated endonuclease Cas1 [Sphingomonas cavernae]
MLHSPIHPGNSDASDWAERSENWISEVAKLAKKRKRRERNSYPLILCGNGVSMRVENGALVIREGFTHYPQERVNHRFFRGDLTLPPRIVLLDGSGTLSFEVLSWLGEQGVALARVKWTGEVAIVASGAGFASDRKKVDWQNATRADDAKRLAFAVDLIHRKLIASISTLEQHIAPSPAHERAVSKVKATIDRLFSGEITEAAGVRALEGECAAAYFAAWQGLSMNWKAMARHPIPDDWLAFSSRSSLANGLKPKNYNASHPVNAILNYAYTVKLAQMQIQAVADGYDPTLGILHHGRRDKPAFIFDLIEPERPKVDAAVLAFIQSRSFSGADFVIRPDGVCRLSPQLARMVATLII